MRVKFLNLAIILVASFILAIAMDYKHFIGTAYLFLGNMEYKLGKIDESMNSYVESLRFSTDKDMVFYGIGNGYYRKKDYSNSILGYYNISSSGGILGFNKFHNLGNSYYRLGEKTKNENEKISLWKNSALNYKAALDVDVDLNKEDTQKNYIFVLEKLKKISPENDSDKQQKSGSGSGQQDTDNTSSGSQSGSGKDSEGRIWTNSQQGFTNFGDSKNEGLTETEKKELSNYSEYLKNFQKENNNLLQKNPNNSDLFDDMVNRLFRGDPNFDDVLPDNTNAGRDW
ncbi:MAG: hypothetical protein PHS92_01835 [Candidatus Gracilibacteria bacterium]|nr:hypothetical protein [Candidatus Gracilibacteria bacterium]